MNLRRRPLEGCIVSLSISEPDDSAKRGYPNWQLNRITVQLAAALLGQGASVVFGHDWREDGVMEAVHSYALQMQSPVSRSPSETRNGGQPLLRNFIPWPDEPTLPREALEMLRSTLVVERAGLPKELRSVKDKAKQAGPDSELFRYVRARAITFLRHQLDNASQARLCLGGSMSRYAGRYPGVIEEALLAVRGQKPLYVSGLLGGATQYIIDALEGKEMPDEFCPPTSLADLYEQPPVREFDPKTVEDRTINRKAVWIDFRTAGIQEIARINRLTIDENRELLHSPVLDHVVKLMLTGLSRIRTV